MRPQMKEIGATFIVLEALSAAEVTKDGHRVLQVLVADESGSIALSLWDSYLEIAQPGSILALSRGYCTLFKGSAILYVGKHGTLQRVGDFDMIFSEYPNMSSGGSSALAHEPEHGGGGSSAAAPQRPRQTLEPQVPFRSQPSPFSPPHQ